MLFNTNTELAAAVEVSRNITLNTLRPALNQAAQEFIIPAIGLELYTELEAAIEANTLSAEQSKLLEYLRNAEGAYGLYLYGPRGMVQVGDAGLMEMSSENTTQTRQWVMQAWLKSQLRAGDAALDRALDYLDLKKASFPTWAGSSAYSENKELLISTAAQLAEHVSISRTRRTYLALRPFILRAQRQQLLELMGSALLNGLLSRNKAGELSADEEKLLEYFVRPALAPFALLNSLHELSLEVSQEGVRYVNYSDGVLKREKADENQLRALANSLETAAEAALSRLKRELISKADTFAEFKESTTYTNSQASEQSPIGSGTGFVSV
jgi:hypothetical protein